METDGKKFGLDLSVNPLTVIAIFVGIVIAWFFYKFINAGKLGLEKISKAADKTAEASGFANSEGQNDPLVLYNQARQAYATAKGYEAGTDNFRNPPGWPDFEAWLKANPDAGPSGTFSLFNTFMGAL